MGMKTMNDHLCMCFTLAEMPKHPQAIKLIIFPFDFRPLFSLIKTVSSLCPLSFTLHNNCPEYPSLSRAVTVLLLFSKPGPTPVIWSWAVYPLTLLVTIVCIHPNCITQFFRYSYYFSVSSTFSVHSLSST